LTHAIPTTASASAVASQEASTGSAAPGSFFFQATHLVVFVVMSPSLRRVPKLSHSASSCSVQQVYQFVWHHRPHRFQIVRGLR
jgi:hypothetical protein